MKYLQWTLGILGSVALIIVILITSFEIAMYAGYGFYEREYEKYEVLDDVQMEMEDVMYVTREMMAYLKGNRDDLVVDTVVNGEEREFFNDREKAHMEDVQNLFLGGLALRRIMLAVTIACYGGLIFMKREWRRILPRAYQIGTGVFFAICIGLTILVSTDFTKYFTIFHEIFFDNDLWLLNPATDLMINILPEGFFVDAAIRIGLFFLGGLVITLTGVTVWDRYERKKLNKD